jgi:hypothetical protein
MPAPDLETRAARVSAHDESLRAIGDSLVDLTKDVRGLARRMDRLESRVDGLQQTVDQHTATLDQHTGMLAEILHILRAAPDGPSVRGEGDPPSRSGDR